jgi:predicted esterase
VPSQDLTGATVSGGGGTQKGSTPIGVSPSSIADVNADASGGAGNGSSGGGGTGSGGTGSGGTSSGGTSSGGTVDPNAGAGPKPTTTCTVSKDSAGFFTRSTTQSSYVAYVPSSYDGTKPVRLIVGLHGCGDNAKNFATWGVNPYDTRATQTHIGISIGGQDGNCWNMGGGDDAKITAAIDDISKCFWVHQKKVSIAGFSSGGQLAYRVGLKNASRFAAILIEDSGLYAADSNPDALLKNASWKLNIAHLTHTSDPVFPLAKVKADWAKTKAAGFPLLTKETAGQHDGVSSDWATWLIPQSAGWTAP